MSSGISTSARSIDAYGGYISEENIVEGDEIRFSGSVHNFGSAEIYIAWMNVTFVEDTEEGVGADPDTHNFTKTYEDDRRRVEAKTTFTDTISSEIDFGANQNFNVSIFFEYSNSSTISPANLGRVYALSNHTVTIGGTSASLNFTQVAILIIILLLGFFGIILIYSRGNR